MTLVTLNFNKSQLVTWGWCSVYIEIRKEIGKKKVIFLPQTTKKEPNEMQQQNLAFLRLPCVVCSNNEKQSWLLVMEPENENTRGNAPVVEAALIKWIDNAP